MGKSLPFTGRLHDFARVITSDKLRRPKLIKPVPKPTPKTRIEPPTEPAKPRRRRVRVESEQMNLSLKKEASSSEKRSHRTPLSEVVSDCVNRWFQETLKEAKAGDRGMQVLVGQMYTSGYGVPRDAVKGLEWLQRASHTRNSIWTIIDKQPGYNASDSDSDENKSGDE